MPVATLSIIKKIKNIFEKKEETKSSITLSLKELEQYAEDEIKKLEDKAVADSSPIVEEIEEVKNDALKILKKIDERTFSEKIEKKMYKPVKTAKPIFIKGMRGALQHIKTRNFQNYDDIIFFHKSFQNSLKSIDSLQKGTGRHVTFVYREEMPRLGTELNSFIDLSNKLKEIIDTKEEDTDSIEEASTNIKEIKNLKEITKESSARKKEIAKKREKSKRDIRELRKKLETLEKSIDFKKLISTQNKVETVKEEKTQLKGQIYNQLHPLKRVFKKFKRITERGNSKLSKEELVILGDYINHPFKTFQSEDKKSLAILNILKESKESIKKGELQLKAKEREKIIEKICNLQKNCADLKERYEKIQKKEISLTEKLSNSKIASDIDKLQKNIKEIENSQEQNINDEKDLDIETFEREKKIIKLLKETETLASEIMGRKIILEEGIVSPIE